MSGITGIVLKSKVKDSDNARFVLALNRMMKTLVYNQTQLKQTYIDDKVFIGNAIPIASQNNDHFIKEVCLPYQIIVDGLVYIDHHEKGIVEAIYRIGPLNNDYQYLPFLYDHYKLDFLTHITGWFNIFIYNDLTHEAFLANDRLGYLPLYLYECNEYFLFASKIESLIGSGLIKDLSFDEVTMFEHLLFHYPLSDHTYIKTICTLPDATHISIHLGQTIYCQYWQVADLFNRTALSKRDSIEAIDYALKYALNKPLKRAINSINFSLTGGWDSRLLLSYLLSHNKDLLNTYSFGAPGSDDIRIPEMIAVKEGFRYTPYLLNQEYLDNHFLSHARDTVRLSGGTRNYKRTHYLYTIKQLVGNSDMLLTGIYGDEILKVGKPQGGVVISPNAINFIESGFDENATLKSLKKSMLSDFFYVSPERLYDDLGARLAAIKVRYGSYETSGQRYFAFRFLINLRKYFGNEVNSYNDFVYCISPFLDYDFLKAFAETKFMVSRYKFKESSLKLKVQSSQLYYNYTNLRNPSLTNYPSSRGFSMKDINSLTGIPKVMYSKLIQKRYEKPIDSFNTKVTDKIFYKFMTENHFFRENPVFRQLCYSPGSENLYSLIFWTSIIQRKYLL